MSFEEPVQGHLHWDDKDYSDGRKDVLKTIVILSVVTVMEVGIAIAYDVITNGKGENKWVINLLMAIFSVVKVYYIMGTFMHVKHEKKWFMITIFSPFAFLIWAIVAFAMEGSSWHTMRNLLNMF